MVLCSVQTLSDVDLNVCANHRTGRKRKNEFVTMPRGRSDTKNPHGTVMREAGKFD